MARTYAIAVNGIDDAVERANIYQESGVDMIFVEAPESIEQMRRITTEIKAPTLANMIPGGKTPILSAKELQELGYAAVAYPTACTYTIAKAVKDLFEELLRTGTIACFDERMVNFEQFNQLVGLPEIRETEKRYYHKIV